MFGWTRRNDDHDTGEAVAAEAAPFELAAIDLLTLDGRFTGWIATNGERTSDWLNANPAVTVHGLSEVPLDGQLADGVSGPDSAPISTVVCESLVFAVPPPLPPNRHLRLHRRRLRIHLAMNEYEVIGQIHVRPGAGAGDYLLRSARQLVPLTDVELIHHGEPAFRRPLPVVIVNARHVTRMIEVDRPRVADVLDESSPVPPTDPRLGLLSAEASAGAELEPALDPEVDTVVANVETADGPTLAALEVLLEAGVLDLVEFQEKRARLLSPAGYQG